MENDKEALAVGVNTMLHIATKLLNATRRWEKKGGCYRRQQEGLELWMIGYLMDVVSELSLRFCNGLLTLC